MTTRGSDTAQDPSWSHTLTAHNSATLSENKIAALEKAIEDLQQNKGKPPPGGGGEPGDEPLVDRSFP